MKLLKYFFFILLFPYITFAQQGYNIKIKIKGNSDSLMYLVNYYADKQLIKDTAKIDIAGYANFKGKEVLPGGIYLGVMQNYKYFEFIIDKEQNFTLETDSADFVKFMNVKGSNDNKMFYDYLGFLNDKYKLVEKWNKLKQNFQDNPDSVKFANDKLELLNKDIQTYKLEFIKNNPETFMAKFFKASKEPEIPEAPIPVQGERDSTYIKRFQYEYYKAHYWDDFDFSDDRLLRTPIFHNKLNQYWKNVLVQHPDSLIKEADWMVEKTKGNPETFKYIVWYTTYNAETSQIMGVDKVFVHLVEKYYMTGKAHWVNDKVLENLTKRAMTLKRLLIGVKATDLLMTDSLGRFMPLHQVKAKYTILYFWDTDCGHCQKETPKLYELYIKLKSENVKVYSVATDNDFSRWTNYVREKGLDWINVYDSKHWTNYKDIYDIISTPILYLLDENKTIIAKKISVDQLEEVINRGIEAKAKTK